MPTKSKSCNICYKELCSSTSVRKHIIAEHFACIYCDQTFENRALTLKHLQENHSVKISKNISDRPKNSRCDICEKNFSEDGLKSHLWRIHFYCREC